MNQQSYAPTPPPQADRQTFTVGTTGSGVPMQIRLRNGTVLATVDGPQGPAGTGPYPLWFRDPYSGQPVCSVQPDGPKSYAVYAADGAPLARLVHRPGGLLPWPRRTRWTAELAHGAGEVTGNSGTWYTWLTCVVLSPVLIPVFILMNIATMFEHGNIEDAGLPARTRWRGAGSTALDYRGVSEVYHFHPRRLDARIAYPLAALHASARA